MWDVIIIGGPTASGKSALALELARHFGSAIISADSRQVYKGMDICTAKPSQIEQREVPHYLIDICEPTNSYNAGQFEKDAMGLITQLLPDKKPIFIVGGTGLYIRALRHGLDQFPEVPQLKQDEIAAFYFQDGLQGLQERLKTVDPVYFETVDRSNPQRLIRAIAVSESGPIPYSDYLSGRNAKRAFTMLPIQLVPDRNWLYERINQRVLEMMAQGLFEEARPFFALRHLPALQTVGYQEIFSCMDGTISLTEAVHLIQQNSRRYAKRQMTWARKETWWHSLLPEPTDTLVERTLEIIRSGP
ncbi:MAG: tRNA (adenosine(37)-N6)-dimethylallyltransferase MiaA [Saprospiraceae bacterium]|nr:tRNA (adenosine(37)-N6)-dimethylallyltransferase MiaA [Saprospiraceae bacterium]